MKPEAAADRPAPRSVPGLDRPQGPLRRNCMTRRGACSGSATAGPCRERRARARDFYGESPRVTEIPKPPPLARAGWLWFRCVSSSSPGVLRISPLAEGASRVAGARLPADAPGGGGFHRRDEPLGYRSVLGRIHSATARLLEPRFEGRMLSGPRESGGTPSAAGEVRLCTVRSSTRLRRRYAPLFFDVGIRSWRRAASS